MDIKDLSVGDWVKSPITNIPYQITGAFITPDVGEIVMLQSNGGEELRCPSESIEPIPITPEVLLKNGFKEHIFPDQYKNAEKCTIVRAGKEWDFNSAIEEYRFIGKYQSLYGLQFVHELQHALRVAGITREFIV